MRHELHDGMLILAPVVIAVTAALGDPWIGAHRAAVAPAAETQTLERACEARLAARSGARAPRPAEVAQCLREATRNLRAARAAD